MESAPQSTINHRAVIALPQNLIFVPHARCSDAECCTALPKERFANRRGGCQSCCACATPGEAKYVLFRRLFRPRKSRLPRSDAGLALGGLEMTVGAPSERQLPALVVEESRGIRSGDHGSDRRQRDTGL